MIDPDTLETIGRKELVRLAKEHGIKANQKSTSLRKELRAVLLLEGRSDGVEAAAPASDEDLKAASAYDEDQKNDLDPPPKEEEKEEEVARGVVDETHVPSSSDLAAAAEELPVTCTSTLEEHRDDTTSMDYEPMSFVNCCEQKNLSSTCTGGNIMGTEEGNDEGMNESVIAPTDNLEAVKGKGKEEGEEADEYAATLPEDAPNEWVISSEESEDGMVLTATENDNSVDKEIDTTPSTGEEKSADGGNAVDGGDASSKEEGSITATHFEEDSQDAALHSLCVTGQLSEIVGSQSALTQELDLSQEGSSCNLHGAATLHGYESGGSEESVNDRREGYESAANAGVGEEGSAFKPEGANMEPPAMSNDDIVEKPSEIDGKDSSAEAFKDLEELVINTEGRKEESSSKESSQPLKDVETKPDVVNSFTVTDVASDYSKSSPSNLHQAKEKKVVPKKANSSVPAWKIAARDFRRRPPSKVENTSFGYKRSEIRAPTVPPPSSSQSKSSQKVVPKKKAKSSVPAWKVAARDFRKKPMSSSEKAPFGSVMKETKSRVPLQRRVPLQSVSNMKDDDQGKSFKASTKRQVAMEVSDRNRKQMEKFVERQNVGREERAKKSVRAEFHRS